MSVQHSPPSTPTTEKMEPEEPTIVNNRKRARVISPTSREPELSTSRSEIESVVNDSVKFAIDSYFRKEFGSLKADLATLKDLEASIKFLSEDYDLVKKELEESKTTINTLTKSNTELSVKVEDLSARLNAIEQYSRESNIELNGVPENKSENLTSLTKQLCSAVSCTIQETEILSCSRVRKMDETSKRPRSIVVKLANTQKRDEVLASVAKYNKANPKQKLHSGLLGYGGTKVPIFVSEHLSPYYKALHARTRKFARENNYEYVWIRNGRIYIRKDEDSPAKHIKNYESLGGI